MPVAIELLTNTVVVVALLLAPGSAHAAKRPAKKTPPVVAKVHAAKGQLTVTVKTGKKLTVVLRHDYCDPKRDDELLTKDEDPPDGYEMCWESYDESVDEVPGSKGRLYFVQLFAERGADYMTREVVAWVVDAATAKVLWTGTGEYQANFDYKRDCTDEEWDVPWAEMKRGKLVIYRDVGGGCKKSRRKLTVETRLKVSKARR